MSTTVGASDGLLSRTASGGASLDELDEDAENGAENDAGNKDAARGGPVHRPGGNGR
ncbi:hypothetical protein GCM10009549_43700 [Streptomyces thermoalcalitolerans]|uniref:Uncharacterized protein n=1 Tax=Streptomyces thermoalcalitolerans TaxID=65605 RepID=A0ABP3ZL57_9ACTN